MKPELVSDFQLLFPSSLFSPSFHVFGLFPTSHRCGSHISDQLRGLTNLCQAKEGILPSYFYSSTYELFSLSSSTELSMHTHAQRSIKHIYIIPTPHSNPSNHTPLILLHLISAGFPPSAQTPPLYQQPPLRTQESTHAPFVALIPPQSSTHRHLIAIPASDSTPALREFLVQYKLTLPRAYPSGSNFSLSLFLSLSLSLSPSPSLFLFLSFLSRLG